MLAEEGEHALGLLVQRRHRAQQRGLLVERLARVGAKRGGDAQDVVLDERRARGVPGGVAAGLERGAQAAVGEARRVGLALDQGFAGKLLDASDSPLIRALPENLVMAVPSWLGSRKLSCFSLVMPESGWNQWA